VSRAVDDLQSYHVTFEEGAVTDEDIEALDEAAARLQDGDGYFKIVVLAEPVEDFAGAQQFADEVLDELGGQGRVLVYDPEELAIASNADPAQEVARAEQAAIAEANRTNSFAEGALEAGQELGISAASGDEGGAEGSGGFSLWWIIIPAGLTLLVLFLARGAISGGGRAPEAAPVSAQVLAEGERKVRDAVNKAANGVIELYDRVNLPDAAQEAKAAYAEGSRIFMDTQDELEEADTQPELEAVYPKLVEAGWHLDVARAVLEAEAKPPKPEPSPLFPSPVPVETAPGAPSPGPLELPERHYRTLGENPWLTTAASAAISLLLSGASGGGWMSWGGAGDDWDDRRWRRGHRPAMGDDVFDVFLGGLLGGAMGGFGGGWGGGGRRGGRGRIRLGGGRPRIRIGGGRGMGRR
jgi:hypothetical protein